MMDFRKNNFVLRMSKAAIKQLEPFLARNATIKEIIHDHIVIERNLVFHLPFSDDTS